MAQPGEWYGALFRGVGCTKQETSPDLLIPPWISISQLQVMSHFELMTEFGVPMGQEDLEAAAGLDGEVWALQDAVWAAEAARERLAERFRR